MHDLISLTHSAALQANCIVEYCACVSEQRFSYMTAVNTPVSFCLFVCVCMRACVRVCS